MNTQTNITDFMRHVFVALGFTAALLSAQAAPREHNLNSAALISGSALFEQPLVWVGDQAPSPAESRVLWDRVRAVKEASRSSNRVELTVTNGSKVTKLYRRSDPDFRSLERFAEEFPSSPWTPALRAGLGHYYRDRGRYTLALQHWEAAWEATKRLEGNGKTVADFTLARWTSLLASLGRTNQLQALFAETEGRVLDGGALQVIFNSAREGYQNMLLSPGTSFMCGAYALYHVSSVLRGTNGPEGRLLDVPSPMQGFSLGELTELSKRFELGLVPMKRVSGSEIVIPSVVHWRQHHYAAIIARMADSYRVVDPTFGHAKWIRADVLNAEASGYFLVPAGQTPSDWETPSRVELAEVHGQGAPNSIDDPDDQHSCYRVGYNGLECQTNCTGMAVWWVSEPYISLWLEDEPLSYQPSHGPTVSFRLSYKERNELPNANYFNFGKKWECQWMSKIVANDFSEDVNVAVYDAYVYLPGGGLSVFESNIGDTIDDHLNNPQHPINQTRLVPVFNGASVIEFHLLHPDGSKDVYGNRIDRVGSVHFLLKQRIDPAGRAISLEYEEVGTPPNTVWQLATVADVDANITTLRYLHPTDNKLVTEVEDPFMRKATLKYNGSGQLTNVTDPAGVWSGFKYDPQGFLTNLHTPYGNTKFQPTGDTGGTNIFFGMVTNIVNRSLLVTDPENGKHLYFYRDTTITTKMLDTIAEPRPAPFFTFSAPWINAFEDNAFRIHRNSWYFNPKQYIELASKNAPTMGAHDLAKGRLRHWLHANKPGLFVSGTLSYERDAGTSTNSPGQFTWYGYPHKPTRHTEGSNSIPGVVATILPGPLGQQDSYWTWYQRNVRGNPTNVVDVFTGTNGIANRTNRFVYAANDIDLIGEYNPDGNLVGGFAYNAAHQPTLYTNAVTNVTVYQYNTRGQLTQSDYPGGLQVINTYAPFSPFHLTSTSDSLLRNTSFTYENGLVKDLTDSRGLTVTHSWDALQRPIRVDFPDGTFVSNRYDKLDLVATQGRVTNDLTKYFYNGVRQLTIITNARNHKTTFDYCQCGVLDSVTDPLSKTTSFIHDLNSRRIRTKYPGAGASFTTNVYDRAGRLVRSRDTANVWLTNEYTVQGLLASVSNSFGRLYKAVHDIHDRPVWVTDANGVVVTNVYDNAGRLIRRLWPDGTHEGFAYGLTGLDYTTNRLGKITRFGRDAAGRLIAETNTLDEVTRYEYNAADDLLSLTNARPSPTVTRWTYDNQGRPMTKKDALGQTLYTYHHDASGRLTNRIDALSKETHYAYDAAGNLTNRFYPADTAAARCTNRFAYNALNRLTNMVDCTGTNRFTYNEVGQPLTEDAPWGSDTLVNTYTNQRRSKLTLGSWTSRYFYDAAGRLSAVSSPAGRFTNQYVGAVLPHTTPVPQKILLPNRAFITNHYNALAQWTNSALVHVSGTNMSFAQLSYDPGGRRTNAFRWGDVRVRYVDDDLTQLRDVSSKDGANANRPHERFQYTYDPAGNLDIRSNNALLHDFTANKLDQVDTITRSGTITVAGSFASPLLSLTINGIAATLYTDNTYAVEGIPLADGQNVFEIVAIGKYGSNATFSVTGIYPAAVTFTYDLNGNLTSDGLRSFAYDTENQLTNVQVAGQWRSEFVYDGLFRRRVRREYTWSSGTWLRTNEVRYIYDGTLVVQERNSNNVVQVSYTRGLDLSGSIGGAGGIGGLLARSAGTNHVYYHADENGNIVAMLHKTRGVVARYSYDPFGNPIMLSGSLADANLYRFSSKEAHPPSGLIYYGRRYYDPSLQRWINRDPIGEVGGVNLHGFVGNGPLNGVDTDGLSWLGLLFDRQAWRQLKRDIFIGDFHPQLDPDSNLSLLGREGLIEPGYVDDGQGGRIYASDMVLDLGLGVFTCAVPPGLGSAGKLGRVGKATRARRAAEGGSKIVFREISVADRARLDAGLSLLPKGTGGTIADQVAGRATRYISASEDIASTARFRRGNGLVAINVNLATRGGTGFVPFKNVLQFLRKAGTARDVRNATTAREVLFKGEIPFEAVTLIRSQ